MDISNYLQISLFADIVKYLVVSRNDITKSEYMLKRLPIGKGFSCFRCLSTFPQPHLFGSYRKTGLDDVEHLNVQRLQTR